jgi:ribosomal protein L37AE/L43A
MKDLINIIQLEFPNIQLIEGNEFYWSPRKKAIIYRQTKNKIRDQWTMLHELSHAILNHKSYNSDLDLLNMEVLAWDKAKEISTRYDINIDDDHIQNCLDTYRNWLHLRSTCPNCGIRTLQITKDIYNCHNCHTKWRVTSAKFCRPYRKIESENKKLPENLSQVTFF